MKILFSVNGYYRNGNIFEKAIFLHFDECRIKVANNPEEFKALVSKLSEMIEEIESSYQSLEI